MITKSHRNICESLIQTTNRCTELQIDALNSFHMALVKRRL